MTLTYDLTTEEHEAVLDAVSREHQRSGDDSLTEDVYLATLVKQRLLTEVEHFRRRLVSDFSASLGAATDERRNELVNLVATAKNEALKVELAAQQQAEADAASVTVTSVDVHE